MEVGPGWGSWAPRSPAPCRPRKPALPFAARFGLAPRPTRQAAQVHRESAPREQTPRCAPLCAAEPVPAALAALASWQTTYPTRRLPRRTAGRTPRPWPHWSSAYSSWPPWSLPSSVSCGASCFSCLPTPLNFGGSGAEEWWEVSTRTMRTVCRSCFSHEQSRRSRPLLEAPLSRSTSIMMTTAEV